MPLFDIIAVLLTLAAIFAYINFRFIKLPMTIGVMVIALALSLAIIVSGEFAIGIKRPIASLLSHIDFNQAFLHGMLSLLLFAGAMHVNLKDLLRDKASILLLATIGVMVSTAIVGWLSWLVLHGVGFTPSIIECLLFGALISPTDPIAVLGIIKTVGVSKDMQTRISGESLFNDGIGVVLFIALLDVAAGGNLTFGKIASIFLAEAVGGAAFGAALGALGIFFLRTIDQYEVEVLVTLAIASGGYVLAEHLHISAPIAIVIAGLLIGSPGRRLAMSALTRTYLDSFWLLIDDTLNAVLFLLIGFQVLVMPFNGRFVFAAAVLIPVVLLARWVSVAGVAGIMRPWRPFAKGEMTLLTWAGLRGGISVALALSLPPGYHSNAIIAVTYQVVIFSIIVQGLTIGPLARKLGFADG